MTTQLAKTSFFADVVSAVRSLNPLDKDPHKFRIVLRFPNAPSFIVAESSRWENIEQHWLVCLRLADAAKSIESLDDCVAFLVTKVQALVAEQEQGRGLATDDDDDVPQHASDAFREAFPDLARNERLLHHFLGTIQKLVFFLFVCFSASRFQ